MANANIKPLVLTQRQVQSTVDKLLIARAELKAAKLAVQNLEELLEAQGPGRYIGKTGEANVLWITSSIFDQGKAKSMLTAGQLAECVKPSEYWKITTKEI